MKQKRLDFVAIKFVTFDTDLFIQEVIDYSKNSIIITFDLQKIAIGYKPPNISLPWDTIRLLTSSKISRYGIRNIFLAIYAIFLYFSIAGYLCIRFRPKVFWSHNLWTAFVAGLCKKIGLCEYTIHVASDWLVSNRLQSPASRFANNIIFPIFDYLGCVLSDLVINSSQKISEARYKYWDKELEKNKLDYPINIKIHENINKRKRNQICFLGTVRYDSGLEMVVPILHELWGKWGIKLVIIGNPTPYTKVIKKLIIANNVQDCVIFYNYLNSEKLKEVLDGCFCGINLITSMENFSIYGVPGKLIDYLRMLIPVIVTEGIGSFAEEVKRNKLGFVIDSREELFKALEELYINNLCYQKNIQNFINNRSSQSVSVYVNNLMQ